MDAHKVKVMIPCNGFEDKYECKIERICVPNHENLDIPILHQTITELSFCLKEMKKDIKNYAI